MRFIKNKMISVISHLSEPSLSGWVPEWSPVPNSVRTIVFTSFLYSLVKSKDHILEDDPREVARAMHMNLSLTNYAGETLTPKGKDAIIFGEDFYRQRSDGRSQRRPLWRCCRIRVCFTR
jgi:hypothetical protein